MRCLALLILFVILSFVAGSGGVIGHTAVAAGFFWLAVARGTGVGWGLSFPWVTLPFPFLTVFRVARLARTVGVAVWVSGSIATATFSCSCISSFPFFLKVVSHRHSVVTQIFLVIMQVVKLEMRVKLEAAMGVKLDDACKGECAFELFVRTVGMYRKI